MSIKALKFQQFEQHCSGVGCRFGQDCCTLNFDNSLVLGLDWRCDGQYLAIAGYQGAKVWHTQDWDEEPYIHRYTLTVAIAWSPDGKYLAAGNVLVDGKYPIDYNGMPSTIQIS